MLKSRLKCTFMSRKIEIYFLSQKVEPPTENGFSKSFYKTTVFLNVTMELLDVHWSRCRKVRFIVVRLFTFCCECVVYYLSAVILHINSMCIFCSLHYGRSDENSFNNHYRVSFYCTVECSNMVFLFVSLSRRNDISFNFIMLLLPLLPTKRQL